MATRGSIINTWRSKMHKSRSFYPQQLQQTWLSDEHLRQMWPTQREPSQWHSPLPPISHQTWLQLSFLDPVPVWAHSFHFLRFSPTARVIKQDAQLRQRLDPAATLVKVKLQKRDDLSNIFYFIHSQRGCFFLPGSALSPVILYCRTEVKAEMFSDVYSSHWVGTNSATGTTWQH